MRFFHLSDLHIGLKLFNRDLREDQEYILAEIVKAAGKEKPDAIVIAGDIYDKAVPSAEAVALFSRFVAELTDVLPAVPVMIISGNHDSGVRLDCFREILSRQNVYMVGVPPAEKGEKIAKVTVRDAYGPVHFYLLPFVKPSAVRQLAGTDENGNTLSYEETLRRLIGREQVNENERNVIVSHQFYVPAGGCPGDVERMDSEVLTVGNIDAVSAQILERFDYGALGHIHKPMSVGNSRLRYCGTPLACSVSEAGQEKGIVFVEMREKGDVRTEVIPLHPIRRIRIIRGELEDVLKESCADYTTVILTDRKELDASDMQDRLRRAFPYLLEVRREISRTADYESVQIREPEPDPFTLCCAFLKDADEAEKKLLQDVINTVMEAGE